MEVEVHEEQLEGKGQQVAEFLLFGQLSHLGQPISLMEPFPEFERLLFGRPLQMAHLALPPRLDFTQALPFLLKFLVEVYQSLRLELLHLGPFHIGLVGVEVGIALAETSVGKAVYFVYLRFL